jgi:hypothetical protein
MLLGDYDGDRGLAIWDPSLVDPFINADLKYLEKPPNLANNFDKIDERVPDFIARVKMESESTRIREMQNYCLSSLKNTVLVGQYSVFHENSVYRYGYSHEKTIELAYMYAMFSLCFFG